MRYRLPILILLLVAASAGAQQRDPEWPCVQVLVPEIVIAVLWPQVIDESQAGAWRKNQQLTAIVERLSDLDEFTDRERHLIADFVESLGSDELGATLNQMAAGIVTLANQRRSHYIDGIKRYTRQQIAIANQIEATLNQLAEFDTSQDEAAISERADIEETLHWHQRVYDQREKAIVSLCERPVELEETLSNVLRELSKYLP